MATKSLTRYFGGMAVGIAMVLIGLVARLPYFVVLGNLLTGASQLLALVAYFEGLSEGPDVVAGGCGPVERPVGQRVA